MSIFISYSHQDHAFVDQFAAHLVRERKTVWVDRWELKPGDSLIQRIQHAVGEADALVVVLSKASVISEWCRKELSVALVRELNEKRVVVIPVLIEDCDIPVFLSDKMYADFRKDFGFGFAGVLEAVAGIGNTVGGRTTAAGATFDWGTEWGFRDDLFRFSVFVVQTESELPFSVLTTVTALGDQRITQRYKVMEANGFGEIVRTSLVAVLGDFAEQIKLSLVLSSSFAEGWAGGIRDPQRGDYTVEVVARRLGTDTGKDTVVHIDRQLKMVLEAVVSGGPRVSKEEMMKFQTLSSTI